MRYERDERREYRQARHRLRERPLFNWATANYERSVRHGEERVLALGYIGDRLHAVVYIDRGANIRIISMRKAERKEMNRYAAP